jgi:hypothetical protein
MTGELAHEYLGVDCVIEECAQAAVFFDKSGAPGFG